MTRTWFWILRMPGGRGKWSANRRPLIAERPRSAREQESRTADNGVFFPLEIRRVIVEG